MNIKEKVNMICDWLKRGYIVYQYGYLDSAAFVKDGNMLITTHYGSFQRRYNKREIEYDIKHTFDSDDEFYIIDNGRIQCTNNDYEAILKQKYTFRFFERDDKTELFRVESTMENMITNCYDIAEKWRDENKKNIVRFDVESNYPHRFLIYFAT